MTAKKLGVATITGFTKNGKSWVAGESVKVQIVKPYFAQKKIEGRYVGQTLRLYDYIVDHSAITPSVVSSSKTNVATIVGTGKNTKIQIKGKGTSKITVTYGTGKNAAKYSISVKATIPSISKTKLKLQTGAAAALKMKNTKQTPVWSSGTLTKYENGKVMALSVGTDTVTAMIDGIEYHCVVEVMPPVIKKGSMTVKVGKKGTVGLKKTKLKNIVWESDNPAVATVDSTGKVTGISPGTATIRTNAGGVENRCLVTVK